jgi:hypothetical protein
MVQPIVSRRVLAVGRNYHVPVGHKEADSVRSRLRKGGVRTTLVIDPLAPMAHLELWPGADPAKAQALLDSLGH